MNFLFFLNKRLLLLYFLVITIPNNQDDKTTKSHLLCSLNNSLLVPEQTITYLSSLGNSDKPNLYWLLTGGGAKTCNDFCFLMIVFWVVWARNYYGKVTQTTVWSQWFSSALNSIISLIKVKHVKTAAVISARCAQQVWEHFDV